MSSWKFNPKDWPPQTQAQKWRELDMEALSKLRLQHSCWALACKGEIVMCSPDFKMVADKGRELMDHEHNYCPILHLNEGPEKLFPRIK
jgi:hypothetical protein